MSVVQDGRYVKDYGDILMAQLRNCSEEWAKSEAAWAASLVDADDGNCRDKLFRCIESSLIATLEKFAKT